MPLFEPAATTVAFHSPYCSDQVDTEYHASTVVYQRRISERRLPIRAAESEEAMPGVCLLVIS